MAIDPYALCPCGSGKKLKFCCGDLASDIEKVHRMIQGEQPHAALKHVEQLMEKEPQRASLLDLRATIELALHNFDAASQTIDNFLAAHPQNGSAHAHAAILTSATKSGTEAIGLLQDALELLEKDMPLRVLEAIGAVGQALLLEGKLVAARGHFLFYAGIAPEGDNRVLELLLRMNLQAGLPLLMRDYLILADCPPDAPWQEQYREATRLSGYGLWRQAEAILAKLRSEAGPAPAIVYGLAVLRGWLGNVSEFAAGLHEYAALDVALEDAVEAEALAQLIDPTSEDPQLETVLLAYPISDDEALSECFSKDRRVEDYPMDPRSQDEDEVTRPRSTHILLDRVPPSSGVDILRADVPHVVGFLTVYGKRTDREARLELTADRDERLDKTQSLLKEIAENSIGELTDTDVLTKKSISEESLSWRWRLPNDTPPDHRRQLLLDERRDAILKRWTAAPRGALGGKSPQEAVAESALRIALLASALIIEQAAVDPAELPLFAELREQLELPLPEPFGPAGLDLEHVSLTRIPRLKLSQLTDEQLARFLNRTTMMGADMATLLVAEELVSRTEHAEDFDLAGAYRQLIHREPDHHKASRWIEQAKAWSQERGESVAEWALTEMELAIQRGDAELVQQALNEIRDSHIKEPGVAEATYRILHAAGLVAPPEAAAAQAPTAQQPPVAAQPANGGQGIWTPGGEEPESGNKPAIWTP